jgi:hypothetical protein
MSSTSLAIPPPVQPSLRARLGRLRLGRPLVIAGLTLAVCAAALVITHTSPRPAISKPAALRLVMANPGTARMLGSLRWDRAEVTPMDPHYEMLGFYRGPRMVASITVGSTSRGTFLDAVDLTRQRYAYGSNIANNLWMLGLLSVVFLLMSAVWPLWRLRNLDALAAASTVSAVVLFNDWTLTRMVLVSYPVLIYLAVRCGWCALASRREPSPSRPLYEWLTRGWTVRQRLRVLRLTAAALALITAMVGFTSLHVLDVGYAVMEGATAILHGLLPYGHIPDILHGDTYPIGSYLLYVPTAALWPVYTAWDDADPTLVVAVAAALLSAAGVARALAKAHPAPPGSSDPSAAARLRAVVAVLAFPPLLVTVSTGTTDVVLGAMLVGMLVVWHRPGWGMAALSAAAAFKLAPVGIVPLFLARLRGRSLARALAVLGLSSMVMLAILIALGGAGAPGRMLTAMSFQLTRSSPHTLWAVVGSVPLQQLAEAATLALLAGAAMRLRRDPELGQDRLRIAALIATVLLAIQICANYWNYMYLTWAMPFIVLWLLAPQRQTMRPPVAGPLEVAGAPGASSRGGSS